MQYTKKMLCALVISGISCSAMAQSDPWVWNWEADSGPFVEAAAGYSNTSNQYVSHGRNVGWNLNGGFMFKGFGVEVGYTNYDDLQYKRDIPVYGTYKQNIQLYGVHAALRVQPNIGPLFFIGKVGYAQLHQGGYDQNDIVVGDQSTYGFFWAGGAGVKLSQNFRIQAQYQQTQGHQDIPTTSMIMLGAGYTFA